MKAAIYCRVSTEEQEDKVPSLKSQLEGCLKKGKELGFDTPKEFIVSETASEETLDRPGLNKLRQWVKNKDVGAVIAYTLDRLCTGPLHFGILQEEMVEDAGVKLILVAENLDDTALGKQMKDDYPSSLF